MVAIQSCVVRPLIAVSVGDPAGIGPEVIVRAMALAPVRACARFLIIGAGTCLERAASVAGVRPFWTIADEAGPWNAESAPVLIDDGGWEGPFETIPNASAGRASFAWVSRAIDLARRTLESPDPINAIVTGPISKQAWAMAGHAQYPGHTELFARRFGVERYGMFFHAEPRGQSPGLDVILATVHVPLMRVREHLSVRRLVDVIGLGHDAMTRLGRTSPRIAVCGLNPHAGEEGILGTDEQEVIVPAIQECRAAGIEVSGPFPADTVFSKALVWEGRAPKFDLVVAMYHDQGLAVLKTLAWDRAVNVTVGLPIVRTSPDHGTGFDIAGTGVADPGSMACALRLAARMSGAQK